MINFKELKDQKQRLAFKNVKYAACDIIGGWENGMLDNPENSEAYKDYEAGLADHKALVEYVYQSALENIYDIGCVAFGKNAESQLKHIRFCGKEFLMQLAEERVTRMGY